MRKPSAALIALILSTLGTGVLRVLDWPTAALIAFALSGLVWAIIYAVVPGRS